MSRSYERADSALRESVEQYLFEHFGLTEALGSHWLWCRGETIWAAPATSLPPQGLQLDAFGMLVARRAPPRGRVSAAFIRRFCQRATARVCKLNDDEASRYLAGEDIAGWSDEWSDGIRIVRVGGDAVGRARVKDGTLICELPKELRVPREVDLAGGIGQEGAHG